MKKIMSLLFVVISSCYLAGDVKALPLEIIDLSVLSGKSYEVVYDDFYIGRMVYIDRGYYFTMIPTYLEGATYIKTANDDKVYTIEDSFLSFNVNQDATVYIGHDNRILQKPSWLSSFIDTGDDFMTDDTDFSLFKKTFNTGAVVLGGNESGGDYSMYSVIILPESVISEVTPASPIGLKIIIIE